MSSEVINLKVHTQFSICEGAVKINQLSEYCREFGLYYERSDKGMPKFDYESYLWDGNIPDKSIWYEEKSLPNSTNKED